MSKSELKLLRVEAAAKSFIRRRSGVETPIGNVRYGWRWYPLKIEKCNLCGEEAKPSMAWPKTLWDHCLSVEHIAQKHGVTAASVKFRIDTLLKEGFKE